MATAIIVGVICAGIFVLLGPIGILVIGLLLLIGGVHKPKD